MTSIIARLTRFSGSPVDRPPGQVLSLLLQSFKNDGGLEAIREILEVFLAEANSPEISPDSPGHLDAMARKVTASGGIKIILALFTSITNSKSIIDSSQSNAIASNERDRGQWNAFFPPQFLVELRMAVLPVVRTIWESDFVDKAMDSHVGCLIDILKTILEGGDEHGAFKRGDELPSAKKPRHRTFSIHNEKINHLVEQGYDTDIAREALYRCMNNQSPALEYCQASKTLPESFRNPIPDYDQEAAPRSASPTPRRSESGTTLPDVDPAASTDAGSSSNQLGDIDRDMVNAILARSINAARSNEEGGPSDDTMEGTGFEQNVSGEIEPADQGDSAHDEPTASASVPPPSAPGAPSEIAGGSNDPMAMSIDNLQDIIRGMSGPNGQEHKSPPRQPSNAQNEGVDTQPKRIPVTLDDLDDERKALRANLIDRALDVLNVHEGVTFELADLINAAALKAEDAKTMRKEIGETLVQSLISLQDDDYRPVGGKIASYANLLALVLQDRDFYEATLDQLKDFFEQFLGFIKIHPDQPADEGSPWVGQILLVIEKLLAEDVQPSQIQWDVPADGKPPGPLADMTPPLVPLDHKIQLFEALSDILLKVGKDESLALSVVRTLVILTRNREIASMLSEKKNIQRLFVMIKQLAGILNDKLPSAFMLLLRHIVEDEDTVRQIMRSEIMSRFEARPGRAPTTDTTGYVKQMYDLVLRSPQIFVEVTNEKLEIARYDSSGGSARPQVLQLKAAPKHDKPSEDSAAKDVGETSEAAPEDKPAEASLSEDVKDSKGEDVQKTKTQEAKAPVVEHPSGVIHYLLQELLSYKDVEDKDSTSARDTALDLSADPSSSSNMTASPVATSTEAPTNPYVSTARETKKPEKPEVLKPSEHPIHVYRNFIIQCLTELLHCYNRTKIEFINFSRKADPKASTPSKPRSGVLNYLLNDIIPVGTLGHEETISYNKKFETSNWAMSAIVSLCLRTNENGYPNKQGSIEEDDEADLLFVRKFVLEHALKAYKDANASEEHPDVRYARLLDLADLFNRLLQGRIHPFSSSSSPDSGTQRSIAKLMFEKNFIGALTSSIADIDLNFPGSKRAIKYILRPLKQLTSTAIVLSQTSDISTTPGQTTDDDEISTATSVSDADEGREETPDLFRNSTLGMFEPGREDESSSESSNDDEEMYEDDYEEGMEYEDGMDRDDDEVISDEEEDLGEAGHMEGLPGDTGMNVEVVIDEEEATEDDDGEDDDDEDDSEDMDDDDEIEVVDEVTGDSENASMAEGDEDGWQDENGEHSEHYDEPDPLDDNDLSRDEASTVRDIVFGGPATALQHLEGLHDEQSDGFERLHQDIESGRYMEEVVHRNEDGGK